MHSPSKVPKGTIENLELLDRHMPFLFVPLGLVMFYGSRFREINLWAIFMLSLRDKRIFVTQTSEVYYEIKKVFKYLNGNHDSRFIVFIDRGWI